jgi:hypothetical protein
MKAIISLNLKNTLKISVSKIKFIKTTDLMPEEIISKINNKYSIIIQKNTNCDYLHFFTNNPGPREEMCIPISDYNIIGLKQTQYLNKTGYRIDNNLYDTVLKEQERANAFLIKNQENITNLILNNQLNLKDYTEIFLQVVN